MQNSSNICPCCSGKEYETCCKIYHDGTLPENALKLMRSRFSAYALNLPNYIVATTHPASPLYSDNKFLWKRQISQHSRNCSFDKLEILDFKETKNTAIVVFTAYITHNGNDATFTERSYFELINNKWLYRWGELSKGHEPNLITTKQLKLLPLAYYGDRVLRDKADPVGEITNDIKTLINEMIETMDACQGIGIAAPQVHHSIRLFVIRRPIETGPDKFEPGEVKVFINPIVSQPSDETWNSQEGCLSIPNIRSQVERPKSITIEYTNLEGKLIKENVSGWEARVILHEFDHIEGILFIDRLPEEERAKYIPFLESLEKRIHDGRAL